MTWACTPSSQAGSPELCSPLLGGPKGWCACDGAPGLGVLGSSKQSPATSGSSLCVCFTRSNLDKNRENCFSKRQLLSVQAHVFLYSFHSSCFLFDALNFMCVCLYIYIYTYIYQHVCSAKMRMCSPKRHSILNVSGESHCHQWLKGLRSWRHRESSVSSWWHWKDQLSLISCLPSPRSKPRQVWNHNDPTRRGGWKAQWWVTEFGHAPFSYFKFKLIINHERREANI